MSKMINDFAQICYYLSKRYFDNGVVLCWHSIRSWTHNTAGAAKWIKREMLIRDLLGRVAVLLVLDWMEWTRREFPLRFFKWLDKRERQENKWLNRSQEVEVMNFFLKPVFPEYISHKDQYTPHVFLSNFWQGEVTCWKRMSTSKVRGSLGLQTGGMVYSRLGGDVHGMSFIVYVPE